MKEGDVWSRKGTGKALPTSKDPNVAALVVASAKLEELKEEMEKITQENNELRKANQNPGLEAPKPIEEKKAEIVYIEKAAHSLNLKSKPTLGYWNIRGLGAQCRYLLHYSGVEFEDKMYKYGPAPDFDRSDWFNEKETLGLDLPNLPYLIDDEIKLTETAAIMKYICAKWSPELLCNDPVNMAKAEMIYDKVQSLKMTSTMPCYQGKTN
jgi:hypothetical protein